LELLVIVTRHFNMAATAGFIDPFRAANYLDAQTRYRWTFASIEGGECPASNGLGIKTEPLSAVRHLDKDLVIVSSSWTPEASYKNTLHTALQAWARKGSTLGAIDTGAFILAKAGLLDGRRTTVHYEHLDAMRELYPEVLTSDELFVFDGNRIACCGGSASLDFALHIVARTYGAPLATAAARYVFHQSIRPTGTRQSPQSPETALAAAPAPLLNAIKLMEKNVEDPLSIPDLARRAGISHRQLDRLFKNFLKKTPALYYRDIRLDRARGLVTQTDLSLAEIAVASGFSSQVHFSAAYRDRFSLPPRRDRIEGRIPFEFRAFPMHRKKP